MIVYNVSQNFTIHEEDDIASILRVAGAEHVGALHPSETSKGRVSIAHITDEGVWREKSYRLDQLPDVIADLAGDDDWFISQQRFLGKRAIAHLLQLAAMYVDLDYHTVAQYAEMR